MPMYSSEGGFTGSAKGSASKSTSTASKGNTATRSSAPNAAAAAASARMSSGNLGKSTPSGVGNQVGGGRSAATSSISRNTVNAAAANASRMAAQRSAGVTQSYGSGKTGLGGANQTFNKGINQSIADRIAAGQNSYQQSSGRPPGLAGLGGLQAATARMNPSISSVVAGDPQARFGNVTTNGEIGGAMGPAGEATFNRAMANMLSAPAKDQSRVPSVSSPTKTAAAGYRDYDPLSSVGQSSGPTPVAGYQNPGKAYPGAPAGARVATNYNPLSSVSPQAQRPVTVADVPQVPNRGVTLRPGVTPSMADVQQTFMTREPSPYDAQTQVAGAPARQTFTQNLLSRGFTGGTPPASQQEATAPQATQMGAPNAAAQRAYNIAAARAAPAPQAPDMSMYGDGPQTPDNSIYGDAPQTPSAKTQIAALLSGSNGREGRSGDGQSEQLQQLVAAASTGDPAAQEALKKWFIWNQWQPGQRPANV